MVEHGEADANAPPVVSNSSMTLAWHGQSTIEPVVTSQNPLRATIRFMCVWPLSQSTTLPKRASKRSSSSARFSPRGLERCAYPWWDSKTT